MFLKTISKNSLILGAFALVTAGLLAFTYKGTAPKIAEEERRAAQKALLEIVPHDRHDNDMLEDVHVLTEAQQKLFHLPADAKINLAKLNGQTVAVIVPAIAPDGYSGDIKIIAGVNIDGSLAGVRVLSHKETPGLGDKVDLAKSDWLLGFNGKNLNNPKLEFWKVKKDGGEFDQFTGATITPRAVVRQVKDILQFVQENREQLFGKLPTEAKQ
ncbi:electron transport complex subunit RsxG [Teredinibacter sp. KSP-S5-2]|uniref:electron transport complex subunit RsxG n=1 Tax=Teredinibacter sp. KSP-S5-2 TaxID=3034506 RepID=UPI0029353279|nr:electron transport complex subunit RsxG [Teredinibacter sp. KSP-S5-2]WNO10246.1 electron transport complex subunit RsxG [Teredinibacter sp. KSP-S5-2]